MEAIKNDIAKRVEKLEDRIIQFENPDRIAATNLLEELAESIDFMQRKVRKQLEDVRFYQESGLSTVSDMRYKDWTISKAALTRLQDRFRNVLEILASS